MPPSIDAFCDALNRSHLLTTEELRQVDRLRRIVDKEGGNLERLPAWLVTHHYLTPFQVRRLLDGHTDHFFLGRYKLLGRLGQGTMARVYKAVCPNGQQFAVKVLTPSRADDPRWRPLFEHEAREATRYRHANIARTFEAGQADGLRYLVMEYLAGETLADVLQRRRRLPPAEAVRIVYQALQGLLHIHEQKGTHCNLEPAHLMLVPACGQADTTLESTVKILDAGLGQPLFEVQAQDAREQISDNGEVALDGQVDYLAPELAGRPDGADIRADIYSLGCILYHCLAGQPPFPAGSNLSKLLRHATETPHALVEINPEVTEGLQLVVGRMMARDPEQRYADPGAAARALLAFLPAERTNAPVPLALPIEAPVARQATATDRPPAPVMDSRTPRRKRALLAAAGLVVLLLVVSLNLGNKTRSPDTPASTAGLGQEPDTPPQDNPRGMSPAPTGIVPAKETQPSKPLLKDNTPTQGSQPKDTKEPKENGPAKESPERKTTPPKEKKPPVSPPRDIPPARLPVPLERDQVRAWGIIREVFRSEYARPAPADRRALAQKLLRQGIETRDDPAARYVLLREARDLAAQSADIELALRALKQLSQEYVVDVVTSKVGLFGQAAKVTAAGAPSKALVDRILEAIPEAIARDEYSSAQDMIALAEPLARRAMNRPLQHKVEVAQQSLKEIHEELQRLRAMGIDPCDVNAGQSVPMDAETCLILGKFFCVYKGDWSRGLPLLAASNDERLREMAREDLTPTTATETQVRRGDSWWGLGDAQRGIVRRQLQGRALHWYRQALPGLSGLTRARVEQRINLAADQ